MDDLRKFGRYFLPYKIELTVGILCILASVVAGLYIPQIVGQAIDANWIDYAQVVYGPWFTKYKSDPAYMEKVDVVRKKTTAMRAKAAEN